MMSIRRSVVVLLCFGIFLVSVGEILAQEASRLSKGQTIYVPVYSSVYIGDRERMFPLTATVSVRNSDPLNSIIVTSADYFDSQGKLLKKYLVDHLQLSPHASTHFVVKESDMSGGPGAGFIIKWQANGTVNAPIVESVMIGTLTQQGISFTSRGQVIEEVKK